jgi:trehalose/maltose hydrolase-like predicted phosphorylase
MTEAAVHGAAARRAIDPWILEFDRYDQAEETLREALCTVGNGRMASRGSAPEQAFVDGLHCPGTYVAGLYNRLTDEVAGRVIENESLVNLPNWLYLTFRFGDAPWFSIDETEILHYRQALEMDRGLLIREVCFRDREGRETSLTQRRLVSMAAPRIAGLETNLRAENWDGEATFRSLIDGRVENRNVDRYRELRGGHLDVIDAGMDDGDRPSLRARTKQSRIEIVTAARHRIWVDDVPGEPVRRAVVEEGAVGEELTVLMRPGVAVRLEKIVCVVTGRDDAISEPGVSSAEELEHAPDFADIEQEHSGCWLSLWRRFDIEIEADPTVRQITNLHTFHLLQVAAPNIIDIDAGIPARGLHGEAYRGHVFWDELFVFPVLHVRSPEVARSLLRYRYRRLPAARRAAAASGYAGAMFPWQSGSDGREETQQVHLNPRSGHWSDDRSHRQRHINIAIAYNLLQYLRFTHDVEFLSEFGAELLVEIARFWASVAEYDRIGDSYQITGVMGPDEFHDHDPHWDGPGLRNNAYTNVMVSWLFAAIPEALQPLPEHQREGLFERIGLDHTEITLWDEISRKLVVPFHDDGIISQFEGYEQLQELDWTLYGERYGNIERLDRILDAEGDSVGRYKVSKQADVLMLFYLLTYEELVEVFARLGVVFDEDMLARNIDYYLERTSHGSTLSRLVHSWVLARSDRRRSVELFRQALESDISDIQGGTTAEGIHLGAMAGTVDMLLRGYSGMSAGADGVLRFKPSLDPELGRLDYCIYYDRRWLYVSLAGEGITLTSEVTSRPPIEVECRGRRVTLASGMTTQFA